jgi:hypothetical protein
MVARQPFESMCSRIRTAMDARQLSNESDGLAVTLGPDGVQQLFSSSGLIKEDDVRDYLA